MKIYEYNIATSNECPSYLSPSYPNIACYSLYECKLL